VTQRERPTRTRLFNPIGRLLDQTIGDTYLHYAARPSDLEGLRRATVLAATVRRDGIAAEEMERVLRSSPVRNPYDGSAFDWDADAGSIVVRGLQRGEPGRKAVLL
jgi:hypothetical protein